MYQAYDGNPTAGRKRIASIVSGVVFSIGFWCLVDAIAYGSHTSTATPLKMLWLIPWLLGCLGVLLVNSFEWVDFQGQGYSEFNTTRARLFFFAGFSILIGTLIAAMTISIQHFLDNEVAKYKWPGAALILASFTQLTSAIILRFGHTQ